MKIAVLGAGVSGLTAAYLLRRRHRVHLFEAAPRAGGHTRTVEVEEEGRRLAVDLGFIVFNRPNYPAFCRLLEELGVASSESDMSFSVRSEALDLEYNGASLNRLFAQRRNLLRPSFYRMLADILRFHRRAPRLLAEGGEGSEPRTLGEYLEREGFGRPFVEWYLVPMAAAIWSTEPRRILEFPARNLVHFLHNHGLLRVEGRPRWRFVRGGSRTYVEAMTAALREAGGRLRLATPVASVRRLAAGVEVLPRGGQAELFDAAVIATHSDQALRLLADPSPAEREVLGAIPYRDNEVVLHTDTSLLPRRRRAWASWNYHLDGALEAGRPARLTYYLNLLQRLETDRPYCVTLNRAADVAPEKVLRRVTFAHPLYTAAAFRAQRRWGEVNGVRRTWFCGAYWGYGFHEDGVRSALRVVRALGEAVGTSSAGGAAEEAAA